MNICLCGILMFKFNWKKKHIPGKKMENGTKKQELFNWFFCTFVSCFFTFSKRCFFHFFQVHFQNAFFSIFSHVLFENALGKHGKTVFWKCERKTRNKCETNVEKKHMWTSSWEGGTLIFLGPVLLQLLPAQLLQVENRRGAVQIDRKWTVQIADLFNISIAKQWLPGAKT